jgi:hypothetical protein
MSWFIKKGEPVEENKPHEITFVTDHPVDSGQPMTEKLHLYCDDTSVAAPIHKNENVRQLATLEADLGGLSTYDLASTILFRKDGKKYYATAGAVECTFLSASTKYVLLSQGRRYDTVSAEYA